MAQKTFSYSYYSDGARKQLTTPAGNYSYEFNANLWPTRFTSAAGDVLYDYYDDGGQILEQVTINAHGGVKGQLLNKINVINKRSKLYRQLSNE